MADRISQFLLDQLYYNKDIESDKDIKQAFLNEYLTDEDTKLSYLVYLNQIAPFERLLGKDLYSFSKKNLLDMFSNAYTVSPTSLRALFSISKNYLSWATSRGKNRTGSSPFDAISFKNEVLPMINMIGIERRFITEEQMWKMEDESINYQDFSALALCFYSVRGVKASEIVNLKGENINGITNTLTLTDDDGSIRELKISQRLLDVVRKAEGEDTYERRGKAGYGNRTTCNLVDSPYVFRPSTINNDGRISAQTCATRIKKVLIDCNYPTLSLNDITNSGKLSLLYKIEAETGEKATIEDYKRVNREFNQSETNYANLKDLKELYEKAISKAE